MKARVTRVRTLGAAFAIGATACAIACSPILGLDDLHDRASAPSTDSGLDAETGQSDAGPACTTNVECIKAALGRPAVCRVGKCVTFNKDLCLPQVLPSNKVLENDNVALFAAFVPVRGSAPLGLPSSLAYTLALNELDRAGGIPGTKRRDVAMMFCASEPDLVEQSVTHVTREIQVPGMIASFGSADMTKFIQDYAKPANVFTVNPSVTPDTLKFADVGQLVWNLLGTAEDVALAYRPLVKRLESYAVAHGRTQNAVKIALVHTDTVLESSIATVIEEGVSIRRGAEAGTRDTTTAISFNGGKSAAQNGAAFFRKLPIAARETGGKPDINAIVASLAAFMPDIVIAITAEETADIVEGLEAKLLAQDAGAAALPYWVLAPRNARDVAPWLKGLSAANRDRFVGVQYAGPTKNDQRKLWLGRMAGEFPDVEPSTYTSVENYYDAVYWLAYGLGSAGPGAQLNGDALRVGVRSMLSGPEIFPGRPDTIGDAFNAIAFGKTTFVGALGPPDIDEKYGTWRSVGGIYCYASSDLDPNTLAPHYDTYRYNPETITIDLTKDATPCVLGF